MADNGSTVYATRAAIQDLLLGDIRITESAMQEPSVDKLVAKALRMQVQAEALGKRVRVHLPDLEVNSFNAAVHYNRAWHSGYQVATRYLELISGYYSGSRYGNVQVDNHETAIRHFSTQLSNGAKSFRSIPSWQLDRALGRLEDELDELDEAADGGKCDDLHLELQNLPQHHSMGRTRKMQLAIWGRCALIVADDFFFELAP